MKYEKSVTINTGNYENVKIGVSEADSFEACGVALDNELSRLCLVSKSVKITEI